MDLTAGMGRQHKDYKGRAIVVLHHAASILIMCCGPHRKVHSDLNLCAAVNVQGPQLVNWSLPSEFVKCLSHGGSKWKIDVFVMCLS